MVRTVLRLMGGGVINFSVHYVMACFRTRLELKPG